MNPATPITATSVGESGWTMWHEIMEQWAEWMRVEGGSEKTVTSRLYGIQALARHSGNTDPVTFTTRQIVAWLAACRNQWTRRTYANHARAWHAWLVEQGLRDDDPTVQTPRPREPRSVPRPAGRDAITAVLGSADRRARAYITLALFEGLRCVEIARVQGEDFNDGGRLLVHGKGGDPRWLPVHPLVAAVRATMPTEGYWFPGSQDGHVRPESVSATVSAAFRRAGYRTTAHQLRHWFGTQVQRDGGDVRVTQELMGHRSVQSTQIYTQVEDQRKAVAVRRLAA